MPRIFIAINLPAGIKEALTNTAQEIQNLFPEEASRGLVRWTAKDNLHITLLFVGETPDEQIPQLCQNVEDACQGQKPLSVAIKRVCYGPPRKIPPRLIWAEVEKNPALLELAEKLENQRFSPHITLGRIKTWQWKQIEPEERPEIEKELSLGFEVKSVEIMESVLKRSGAEYSILKSIAFE